MSKSNEQHFDVREYLEIHDNNKDNVVIVMNFWLQHHEKEIDNHFNKNSSNDDE